MPPNKIIETVLKTFTKPTIDREEKAPTHLWHRGSVILDLYEVQEAFTGGGMGVVYKVYHRNWHMALAVKSPKSEFFESQVQKDNFIRECETWINLGLHPNIVSCYYVREIDDIPRVFCEFIEGGSLKDWITDKRLYAGSQEEVLARMLDIAIQFAWGLQYAHEANLVHQDVKPANVMLREDGTPLVTDFGLAKAKGISGQSIRSDNQQSISVTSGGYTPAYCSPEQFSEQPVTRKTDVWSWAVSILEMFTGEIIWQGGQLAGGSLDVVLKEGTQHPDIPAIPPELGTLLQKCLQYKAEDRPTGMQEISEELQRIYQSVTGKAYPRKYPQAAEIDAGSLNNRAISYLDLGKEAEAEQLFQEALAKHPGHLDTTYNYGIWMWQNAKSDDWTILNQLDACGESLSEPGKKDFYKAQIHLARLDVESAQECLENAKMSGFPDLLYKSLIADLNKYKNSESIIRSFDNHKELVSSLFFSINGKWLLTGDWANLMKLWDIDTTKCIQTFRGREKESRSLYYSSDYEGHTRYVDSVYMTSNNRFAISGASDKINIWDVKTGLCLRSLKGHSSSVGALCISPDNRWLLSGSLDKTIRLWDIDSGECIQTYNDETIENSIHFVSFLSKRDWIIYESSGNKLIIRDIHTGKIIKKMDGYTYDKSSIHIDKKTNWVLLVNKDNQIELIDLISHTLLQTFKGHTAKITTLCFSNDCSWFLSGSLDNTIKRWDIKSGNCLQTISSTIKGIRSLCVSHNNRWFVAKYDDKSLKVFEITTGKCLRTIIKNISWTPYAFTKSGNEIVYSSYSDVVGDLKLFDVQKYDSLLKRNEKISYFLSGVRSTSELMSVSSKLDDILKNIQLIDNKTEYDVVRLIKEAQSLPGCEKDLRVLDIKRRVTSNIGFQDIKNVWFLYSIEDEYRGVHAANFTNEFNRLVSLGQEKIKVWDIGNRKLVSSSDFQPIKEAMYFSKDGKFVVCGDADYTIKLWDISNSKCLKILEGHDFYASSLYVSIDGKFVVSGAENIKLWDLDTDNCIAINHDETDEILALYLSRDCSKIFALCESNTSFGDSSVKVWDVATGKCTNISKIERSVSSGRFIDDGRYCLIEGVYRDIWLVDVFTGEIIQTYDHEDNVNSINISLNENFAISSSKDKTVKIWNIQSGECLFTLTGFNDEVKDVAFSNDCWQIITLGFDGTIKLWQLDWELELNDVVVSPEN